MVEVQTIILSLKNSSPGFDECPVSIAKQCIPNYITPLTHLINVSIKGGVSPTELKLVRVLLIYKGGDSGTINNYRAISVLLFFKYLRKLCINMFKILWTVKYYLQR